MVPLPPHLMGKTPAVSFSENEGGERLRRLTISSQPSLANILSLAPPLRKPSLTLTRKNSTADLLLALKLSLRVNSPVDRSPKLKLFYMSPLPPPVVLEQKDSLSRKSLSKKTVVEAPSGPPVPFQHFLQFSDDGKVHILLACTGSVATIKIPQIIDKLVQIYGDKISIQLVVTKCALHFLKGLKINAGVKIWRDEDEWANFGDQYVAAAGKKKNPFEKMILHNELRRWADLLLVAPLSANTLAKISNGICDNLLTLIIRLWGPVTLSLAVKKPIIVAPAMNTFMYTHPITAKQLAVIQLDMFGIEVLKPVEKVLVCGDIGMGGMREWLDIVDIVRRRVSQIKRERFELEGIPNDSDDEEDEDDEDDEEDDDEDSDDGVHTIPEEDEESSSM